MSPEKFTVPAMPAGAASAQIAYEGSAASGGFLQRPFVQNILPFVTSLSLHSAILIIGLLTYTAIRIIHQPSMNQVVPADTALMDNVGPPSYVGSAEKPWRTQQDKIPDPVTNGANFDRGSSELRVTGGGAAGDNAALLVVGVGAFGRGGTTGFSSGPGTGSGDGNGALAAFGLPRQGGVKSPIFGPPAAHRIAYVCDSSGSMINKMASLKFELARAVTGLRVTQSFSIVFFQGGNRPEMLNASLLPATPENKRKAGNYLETITATGTTEPLPGIEAAFRQQPELIYLLTDGDFPDNTEVLARIRALNKGHKVRVNTIAFVSASDNDTAFIDLLKTIASENGGSYRHVSEEELQ